MNMKSKWEIKEKYLSFRHFKKFLWGFVRTVIIAGLCYLILYPFLVKAINALKPYSDLIDTTVRFFPTGLTMETIRRTVSKIHYWTALFNTAWISLVVAALQTFVSALVGYGFAKFKFPGRRILFFFVILMLIIPPQTTMVSMFTRFSQLHILDTPFPLFIMAMTMTGLKNGLYIFIFRQFFSDMPKELNEAAAMDGCGVFKTFYTLMLPAASAMLTTAFLLSFSWQWTDTVFNGLYLKNVSVLSNVINLAFSGELRAMGGAMTHTAALLAILPLAVIYIFAQRAFVESIERSGIVG